MVAAAEVAALVEPSAAIKKRTPAEIEEDEGEAQHLKKHMRWHARVAALQRIPRMAQVAAASATTVEREAGIVDACAGQGSAFYSHSAAQSDAPSPATALTALPITAGRTATPSQAPSFLASDDHRCLANGEVHRVGTLPVHSPSFGAMPGGGPRGKKRKSPRLSVGIFRSPLSRMMLSPISRTSFTPSPRATHVTSHRARCTIDLNAEPEDVNTEMEEENDVIGGAPPTQVRVSRKEVPDDIKRAVFDALLAKSKSGTLVGHETGEVSMEFSVHIRTVQRIWEKGKQCLDQGIPVNVSSGKSKRGRKKKEVDISKLRGLSILSRTTLDDTSKELGCSRSKLHSLKREGVIQRVSNSIKPFLTDKNKKERLQWCLSMLDPRSVPHDPIFKDLFDFVFIDEKWFNITKRTQRYYKTKDEVQQTRTCKSTNFIPKIMFLTAFARPRFSNGICTFDGKIGCFAFVTMEAAKRSSVNRKAGTMEMKPIQSVNQSVIREFLIDKVLPAIRAKWPREDINKPIFIQQDNAPSHVPPNDKLFCEAAKKDGFDIRLVCQPPNSPDFNILDLGFFSSIQSLQYKTSAKTTAELVAAVDEAFQDYSPWKADRIFLTLHGCLKEVMKIDGGNAYDVPHIRKEMLEREGRLPVQLDCEPALVQKAMDKLNE